MKVELALESFTGFYESIYSQEIDEYIESDLNMRGWLYEETNIKIDFEELAKRIVKATIELDFFDEFDFISNVEYSDLYQPKYYNFQTDRIFFNCDFDLTQFKAFLLDLEEYDIDLIEDLVETKHTSCDGFISFHSNDWESWKKDIFNCTELDKDLKYKIGFIIGILMDYYNDFDNYSFDNHIHEKLSLNGSYYDCYELSQ
jgi:hypothetical protein